VNHSRDVSDPTTSHESVRLLIMKRHRPLTENVRNHNKRQRRRPPPPPPLSAVAVAVAVAAAAAAPAAPAAPAPNKKQKKKQKQKKKKKGSLTKSSPDVALIPYQRIKVYSPLYDLFFAGTITSVADDGVISVVYDNGERWTHDASCEFFFVGEEELEQDVSVGDDLEIYLRDFDQFHPCSVVEEVPGKCFAIRYYDGTEEIVDVRFEVYRRNPSSTRASSSRALPSSSKSAVRTVKYDEIDNTGWRRILRSHGYDPSILREHQTLLRRSSALVNAVKKGGSRSSTARILISNLFREGNNQLAYALQCLHNGGGAGLAKVYKLVNGGKIFVQSSSSFTTRRLARWESVSLRAGIPASIVDEIQTMKMEDIAADLFPYMQFPMSQYQSKIGLGGMSCKQQYDLKKEAMGLFFLQYSNSKNHNHSHFRFWKNLYDVEGCNSSTKCGILFQHFLFAEQQSLLVAKGFEQSVLAVGC